MSSVSYLGLTLIFVSMIVFTTCLILHCSRHFAIRCCIRSKNYVNASHQNLKKGKGQRTSLRDHGDNLMRQIKRKENFCRCCFVAVDDNFDFFPISFLFYNIYVIIISILIICKYTVLSIESEPIFTFSNNDHIKNFNVSNNNNNNINHNYNTMVDWIIVYSLILLSIWESLFNFYRFYSTYFASKKIIILNPRQILLKFNIFGIPFLFIFLIQIHLYYYLYPIIIITYFIFNVMTVWLFGHILIVQYRFVMGTEQYLSNIHDDMLRSVYLMRRVSLISSICSSIYISLFTLVYNINITLFVPILWAVSCICLTLNFARNRQYIHDKYLEFKLWYKSISCHNEKSNVKTSMLSSHNNPQSNIQEATDSKSPKSPRNGAIITSPTTTNNNNNDNNINRIPNVISPVSNNNNVISPVSSSNHSVLSNNHNPIQSPMTKPRLANIDSGAEMDKLPQTALPNINENVEINEIYHQQSPAIDSPSLLMSPHHNDNNPNIPSLQQQNSFSSSTSKIKWYSRVKNKINTPLARNQDMIIDFSLSPINIPNSPNNIYNARGNNSHLTSPNTAMSSRKKNTKAMKLLGIEPSPGSSNSAQSGTGSNNQHQQQQHNASSTMPRYLPPTTPMPSLFTHLYYKKPVFPAAVPPPPPNQIYEEYDDDEIDEEEVDDIDDDMNEEIRDEFNEEEMLEMTRKHREKGMIRVSAKHEIFIPRISTKIDDTPPGLQMMKGIRCKSNPNTPSKSPSKSASKSKSKTRSPFSIRKKKENKITLLDINNDEEEVKTPIHSDQDTIDLDINNTFTLNPDYNGRKRKLTDDLRISVTNTNTITNNSNDAIIEISESEDEPEPSLESMPKSNKTDHAKHKRSQSTMNMDEITKQQQKKVENNTGFGAFFAKLNIGTPRTMNPKFNERVRSLSDAKASNEDSNHIKMFKNTTKAFGRENTAPTGNNNDHGGNPDVVPLFKMLAIHGFYSTQNVISAQQLRDYNMKM